MSLEVLERFHRALIEEIQTQRPEYLTRPFTVAEIYQNLVPYGSHRDRIGVEMNADYEDALLRMLAGEGGFLVLESEPALEKIRAELEVANPNTGVYREYAAVDVRLNQSRLDLSAAAIDEIRDLARELDADIVPAALDERSLTGSAPPDDGGSAPPDTGIVPPAVEVLGRRNGPSSNVPPATPPDAEPSTFREVDGEQPAELPGPTEVDTDDEEAGDVPAGGLQPEFVEKERPRSAGRGGGEACAWCRETLPDRATLNFCPFCGTDQGLVPCPNCGDEIESGWRYCASCGTEVDAS